MPDWINIMGANPDTLEAVRYPLDMPNSPFLGHNPHQLFAVKTVFSGRLLKQRIYFYQFSAAKNASYKRDCKNRFDTGCGAGNYRYGAGGSDGSDRGITHGNAFFGPGAVLPVGEIS